MRIQLNVETYGKGPWLLFLLASLCVVTCPVASPAQDVTRLDPVAEEYNLGGFRYRAPSEDGWRQVANAQQTMEMTYSEQLDEERILGRCFLTAGTFEIPQDSRGNSGQDLARISMRQQTVVRGDNLVAYSQVAPVAGSDEIYTYALISKSVDGGDDVIDVYFLSRASDGTQYLIIQFVTPRGRLSRRGLLQAVLRVAGVTSLCGADRRAGPPL